MPIHNEDIAAIFEELANLLEIENANPFRVRAYRNAARTVGGLGKEVSELIAEGKDLTRLPGIGRDLAAKIVEVLETGHVRKLNELHERLPATLEDLMRIPGLGPKRVKILYVELGIETPAQLAQAARQGRLKSLSGFGAKSERTLLAHIAKRRRSKPRVARGTVIDLAEALVADLKKAKGVSQVVVAGSYRRGQETVRDLDILVTAEPTKGVMERFTGSDQVDEVVSRGRTRSSVILHNGLQVDLRAVSKDSFGAALHYFTGSKAHNIQMRRLAQQRGLKINEYGVFKGDKRIAGKTEASVFRAVGLSLIPPELREGRGEIEAARNKRLPALVSWEDLKGDLHAHTDASDGRASLEDMARAARRRGLKYLAITDHASAVTVAHGLDADRVLRQVEAIDELNGRLKGFRVLKGIEVDILEDGRLYLPDSVLGRLDLVIGAVHSGFELPRQKQTDRILKAMDHRYFSLLAHPSGRLLGERGAYDVDMMRVIRHAAERGCYLELDSQPKRLDLDDNYCRIARDEGVMVSIDSDAHSEQGFEHLHLGVAQARRGWLEKRHVLNTRTLRELRALLKRTMV